MIQSYLHACQQSKLQELQTPTEVKVKPKVKKRFRGHVWSKSGSKKDRRVARQNSSRNLFYTVTRGWRPGIFKLRKNATVQTKDYHNPLIQTFKTSLSEADQYMHCNREYLSGVNTNLPPAPQTPKPPEEFVYPTTMRHNLQSYFRHYVNCLNS